MMPKFLLGSPIVNRTGTLNSVPLPFSFGLALHADDGVGLVFNQDGLAYNLGIGVVAMLPKPVRENHNVIIARAAFVRQKVTPKQHLMSYGFRLEPRSAR